MLRPGSRMSLAVLLGQTIFCDFRAEAEERADDIKITETLTSVSYEVKLKKRLTI